MGDVTERSPLLGPPPAPRRTSARREEWIQRGVNISRRSFVCIALFAIGCIGVITAIFLSVWPNTTAGSSVSLSVLSLMVWGSPSSFGTEDKALRIEAIGNLTSRPDVDVFILSDLWMRPDHTKIMGLIPEGYDMSTVDDLSVSSCDGTIAPEFCSGLAVVTRFPVLDIEFTAFEWSGDFLWDYEYFLRRGVGRVRIEPQSGVTVDLFVTSLASMDYNYWYREHQVTQLMELVRGSTADYVVLGGDFNVDPRDGENTYRAVRAELKDSVEEFYKDDKTKWLDPSLATLGNPRNSYTSKGEHPVIYDYLWYKAVSGKTVTVDQYQVPILTTGGIGNVSLSTHEAVVVKLKLA